CESCARNGIVNCRVWVFQGREYTEAPKGMIVNAILQEVYGGQPQATAPLVPCEEVPENLQRFFAGKARQPVSEALPCCPPVEQTSCCVPSAKALCCGTSAPESCGCR